MGVREDKVVPPIPVHLLHDEAVVGEEDAPAHVLPQLPPLHVTQHNNSTFKTINNAISISLYGKISISFLWEIFHKF